MTADDLLQFAFHQLDASDRASVFTADGMAATMRTSKNTLYRHFDGRDQVVFELVRRACVRNADDLDRVGAIRDPMLALDGWFASWANHVDRVPRALHVDPNLRSDVHNHGTRLSS